MSYMKITKELAELLNMDADEAHLRDTIMSKFDTYLREHECRGPSCANIYPNVPLTKLLRLTEDIDDKLTHSKLLDKLKQHHLVDVTSPSNRPHYIRISKELAKFLNIDANGVYSTPTMIMREFDTYLHEHECREPYSDEIYPNVPLTKLLRLTEDIDKLTHSELLDKLKQHHLVDVSSCIRVSKELAEFLNIVADEVYRCTMIMSMIMSKMDTYLREHECREPYSEEICPNAPLSKLLRLTPREDRLTAYNVFEKLKHHLTVFEPPLDKVKHKTETKTEAYKLPYVHISKELADFLNIDSRIVYPRSSVVKELNVYMTLNHCTEVRCSKICPNFPLTRLLRLTEDDKLTYFNLVEKLQCHLTEVATPNVAIEEPDSSRETQVTGVADGIPLYVIYHKTFENTNVITTDKNNINRIVQQLVLDNESTEGEWLCRKLIEHRMFEAAL